MSALAAWKERLGYYEARRSFLRQPFLRALRPSDGFLVGHPKSGNTWLAYMIAILASGNSGTVTLRSVGRFVPFVHGRDDRIRRYRDLKDPRLFRNENPQYPELYPKTLYLVRDPRAALVSFWHMYQILFDDRTLPLGQFIDQYMSMRGVFETWNRKLRRWDRQVGDHLERASTDERILIVRYEDMVEDRQGSLRKVAAFLEIPRDDHAIRRAADQGSFEAMRQVEDRFGAEAYEGKARGKGRFVRLGRPEGWREEMDPVVAARIDSEFGHVMRLAGYM